MKFFRRRALVVLPVLLLVAARASSATCTVSVANDDQVAARYTFASLAPGATVCVAPGTYKRTFVIASAHGTAAKPLTFVVNPAGGSAQLLGGLLLRNVSYVNVSGFTVRSDPARGPGSAITLDVGTHHSSITGTTVEGAFVGIAIGSSEGPAGAGNDINGNVVRGSWNTGIGISPLSDGTPTEPNRIRNNRVTGSGGHGIESSDANNASIENNTVSGSGTGVNSVQEGGYSGIHLFASGPSGTKGPHGARCTSNIIVSNTVTGTLERPGRAVCRDGSGSGRCADGNGIQVDVYCSGNEVAMNRVSGNAGNGISIFGASGNTIRGNVASGNNLQVDRIAFLPGPAEIAVTASPLPSSSASGNSVFDNVATTVVNRIPAFYLAPNTGTNTIGPNNRWNWAPESRPGRDWSPVVLGTRGYNSSAEVDRATGTTANSAGLP